MAILYSVIGLWKGMPLYGNTRDAYTTTVEAYMIAYLAGLGEETPGNPGSAPTLNQLRFQQRLWSQNITVDALLGATVEVGPLEDDTTINAPLNAGEGFSLVFLLTQDGAGNHAVNWNPIFRDPPIVAPGAGQLTVATFVFNGEQWV
jgi:hypothetical protein